MERKTAMMHAEKIASAITAAKAALDGDESFDGVLSTLTAITASLQDSEQYLPALNPIIQNYTNYLMGWKMSVKRYGNRNLKLNLMHPNCLKSKLVWIYYTACPLNTDKRQRKC